MNVFSLFIFTSSECYLFFMILALFFFYICFQLSLFLKYPRLYNQQFYLTMLLLFNTLFLNFNSSNFNTISVYQFFYKDDFTTVIQLVTLIFTIFFFSITFHYVKSQSFDSFEFSILILFSVLSLILLSSCSNFMTLYLLLEFQSFCFYILTAFHKKNQYSLESGLKYFILGSFSSIILLFGIVLLYGYTGIFFFYDLSTFFMCSIFEEHTHDYYYLLFSIFLIAVGFFFKLYAAPFHFWVSDIYQGSPLMVTCFFSTVPYLSIFYLFFKIYNLIFFHFYDFLVPFIFFTSFFSLFSGLFGALSQNKIKRLIAYSSITGTGYFFTIFFGDNLLLVENAFLFLVLYIISLFSIFLIFLELKIHKTKNYLERTTLLSGFFEKNKLFSICLFIFLFSLAGLPPFSTFIGKLGIISVLFIEQYYFFIFLILITSFGSCYYYLNLIQYLFYKKESKPYFLFKFSFSNSFFIIYLSIFHFLFIFSPSVISLFFEYSSFVFYE